MELREPLAAFQDLGVAITDVLDEIVGPLVAGVGGDDSSARQIGFWRRPVADGHQRPVARERCGAAPLCR